MARAAEKEKKARQQLKDDPALSQWEKTGALPERPLASLGKWLGKDGVGWGTARRVGRRAGARAHPSIDPSAAEDAKESAWVGAAGEGWE
eukprot:gene18627-25383_t